MATTTVTTPEAAPVTPVTPAAPKPGTPEGNAALAAMVPANLPEKFRNADGTANVAALVDAYKAAENKISGQPAPVVKAPEVDAEVNLDAAFTAVKTDGAWKTAQAELAADGKISEATRATLRKQHNADDNMIDGMAQGFKLAREATGRRLAAAVGGAENLNKTIEWAKANMKPEEVQGLRSALETINGPLILRGLYAEMTSKTVTDAPAAQSREPSSILDVSPTGAKGQEITPFTSRQEMLAAFKDPRQSYDRNYQIWTAKRMQMTTKN